MSKVGSCILKLTTAINVQVNALSSSTLGDGSPKISRSATFNCTLQSSKYVHSFPPPSSYSPKNAPRWGPTLPQKEYTHGVPFKDGWELVEGCELLPDGQVFEPPARKGKTKHDFSAHRDWERRTISRRMSGSFECLLADTETARNPAFIARYRAPRDLALQSVV